MIVATLYFLLRFPLSLLPPIPYLWRLAIRAIDIPFARLLLFLFGTFLQNENSLFPPPLTTLPGVFWISQTPISPKKKSPSNTSLSVQSGDVIFCNRISYTDILLALFLWSPSFVSGPSFVASSSSERKIASEDEKFGRAKGEGSVPEGGLVYVCTWVQAWVDTIYNTPRPLPASGLPGTLSVYWDCVSLLILCWCALVKAPYMFL